MDGNNRWAKRQGVASTVGHRAGVERVRDILSACRDRGVKTLTLFAFSSENWGRPQPEVRALFALFYHYLRREVSKLNEDGVRLRFIGRRDRLNPQLVRLMEQSERLTAQNERATLVLAVDFGGRWEMAEIAARLARKVVSDELTPEGITERVFEAELRNGSVGPVDLCIRTGGEERVSNFLLWQLSYAELYFTETLWPDFNAREFDVALQAYAQRDRRFGVRPV
jgi:undecaprenyl diphosphate synthase